MREGFATRTIVLAMCACAAAACEDLGPLLGADSGSAADSGIQTDSGVLTDAGVLTDSGSAVDSGNQTDSAAPVDAGSLADAGSATDSGATMSSDGSAGGTGDPTDAGDRDASSGTQPVADAIIVSPSGNDNARGTLSDPYKTVGKAQSVASAGATIYLRAGDYAGTINIDKSGAAGKPITYAAYPGDVVTVTGSSNQYYGQGIILLAKVHDVIVRGIEFRNGKGQGIKVQDSSNILIADNKVHDTQLGGLVVSGNHITLDGNEVYAACLTNTNGSYGGGGWPAALSSEKLSTGAISTNIDIVHNYSHDNWGEGIDAWMLDGGTVDGNRSVDNFSVLLYVDDSKNIRVTNNEVGLTRTMYRRKDGALANSIAITSETGTQRPSNLVIDGNSVTGMVNHGIAFYDYAANRVTPILQGSQPQSF